MAEIPLRCFSCQTEMLFQHPPGRRDECPKCGADVHCCRNCQHYDPKSYNECRETSAEVVQVKDRSNFCDHFTPALGSSAQDREKNLRSAAEALFKKKS